MHRRAAWCDEGSRHGPNTGSGPNEELRSDAELGVTIKARNHDQTPHKLRGQAPGKLRGQAPNQPVGHVCDQRSKYMFFPVADSGTPSATSASMRPILRATGPIRYMIRLSTLCMEAVFTADDTAMPRSISLQAQ